jgi:HK97 family phage prohead protease
MRETRSFKTELRTEQSGGKTFLVGRAASFGVMSHDLGGWREIIEHGAFDDALAAPDLDVVHNVNHDPSKILGRTLSGTTTLTSDVRGLNYRTLLPDVTYARDLAELCKRGDVSQSSFAFTVDPDDEDWSDTDDPDNPGERCGLRTISRVSRLFDVATVASPAYPGTAAGITDRSLPASMPAELRARILQRAEDDDTCDCECPECIAGACDDCSNPDCTDENCRCEQSMRAAHPRGAGDGGKTKRVDGEDLHADCFVIVGDPKDPETWNLPWKFSAEGETENHLRDALARFDQVKGLSESEKDEAWTKLTHLCKAHNIQVDDDDERTRRELDLELATLD